MSTTGRLNHRTTMTGVNNPAYQASKNVFNDSFIASLGATGALMMRDTGQADGWGWLPAVAVGSVLVSTGVGSEPQWSAAPTVSGITTNYVALSNGVDTVVVQATVPTNGGTLTLDLSGLGGGFGPFTATFSINADGIALNQSLSTTDSPTFANPIVTSIRVSNAGLKLADSDASHYQVWRTSTNLTADRTFILATGDADRTLTLSGNPTLDDWFNQSVKTSASPTFVTVTAGTSVITPTVYGSVSANGDITIDGTSHATKTTSYVLLQPTAGNVGINTGALALNANLVVGGAGATAGMEVVVTSGVVFQAYNRNTSAYASFNIDAATMRFRPSGANGWMVDASSNLLAFTDGVGDIGATGATRPNNVFVKGTITTGAGTTTAAPLMLTNGTNLTAATANAIENDGAAIYTTVTTTNGRTFNDSWNYFRLTGSGTGITTIADFFGANDGIPLVANGIYEIEWNCYFSQATAGTATWTVVTATTALANITGEYVGSPVGGIGTVGTPQTAAINTTASSSTAFPVTGSEANGATHYFRIRVLVTAGNGASNTRLRLTMSAGTATPLINSYFRVRRLSGANVGAFVA